MRRFLLTIVLLLGCLLPAECRPQVIVVIADHLSLSDLTCAELTHVQQVRQSGACGLMSPGLARGSDSVAGVYATLGAGDTVGVGDISQGLLTQALAANGVRTALIGDADGDDTGEYRPANLVLPTPNLSLVKSGDGTVPDPAFPGGKCISPQLLCRQTVAALQACDLVVVHFGDFSRIERENKAGDLLPAVYLNHHRAAMQSLDTYLGLLSALPNASPPADKRILCVLVPTPALNTSGTWDQLTPFLMAALPLLRSSGESTLTSATTQTVGLVATRDFAPTLLAAYHLPIPIQMTGAPIVPAHAVDSGTYLSHLDTITRLNQDVQIPLFWVIGWLGAVTVFAGLGLYVTGRLTRSNRTQPSVLYGLRLQAAWPLALLLAPLCLPHSVPGYLGWIGLLTALIALIPSPPLIFTVTALVLLGDGLTGTTLVSQSVLSAYALAGIRFYGIGNEYMGLLMGGALLACCLPLFAAKSAQAGWGRWVAAWLLAVVFVLSFPTFGAKAGGAITAAATFFLAWRRLTAKPITWKHVIVGISAGFLIVFAWGILSQILGLRRTHIETAVGALGHGRFGYILGVTLRKIGLAVHVFLHPGTLLGILAFVLVGIVIRLLAKQRLQSYMAQNPKLAAVSEAGLWGCLISVLFNDSGIVAAILLFTCLVLSVLHGIFEETKCVSSP